jgi:hypothetical protein
MQPIGGYYWPPEAYPSGRAPAGVPTSGMVRSGPYGPMPGSVSSASGLPLDIPAADYTGSPSYSPTGPTSPPGYAVNHSLFGVPYQVNAFDDYYGNTSYGDLPSFLRPPNENVSPGLSTNYYPSDIAGEPSVYAPGGQRQQQPRYPDLSNAPPVTVDSQYPDLSNAPTVQVSPPGQQPSSPDLNVGQPIPAMQVLLNLNTGYPIPGAGGQAIGDWGQNARAGYQPWQIAANQASSARGFGGGSLPGIGSLGDRGGAGWQTVSDIPSGAFGSIGPGNAFGGGGFRPLIL